jgi:hypothetical protein
MVIGNGAGTAFILEAIGLPFDVDCVGVVEQTVGFLIKLYLL